MIGQIHPSAAGLLGGGRSEADLLPYPYVAFWRVDGLTLADPVIDRKEISGSLPAVLQRLDEIASANVPVSTSLLSGAVERSLSDYPLEALRQLLRNAVLHRDYETSTAPIQWFWFADRIELHNPRVLASKAHRHGVGLTRAESACAQNGNPPLELLLQPKHFAVILRARRSDRPLPSRNED